MNRFLMVSAAALMVGMGGVAHAGDYTRADAPAFQTTDNNYSDIQQLTSVTATSGNAALVEQATTAKQNESTVFQNGGNNLVGARTVGGDVDTTIAGVNQGGTSNNISKIDQGTSLSSVDNNTAVVTQNGTNNTNSSTISQQSNGNTANVAQGDNTTTSSGGAGTNTSTAFITQDTDSGNGAYVEQGGSNANNFAEVGQHGGSNTAYVDQSGSGIYNTSYTLQSGDGNYAKTTQK